MSAALDSIANLAQQILDSVDDLREQFPEETASLASIAADFRRRADELDVLAKRISTVRTWAPTEKGDWAIAREIARWQGLDKKWRWNEADVTSWLLTGPGPFTAEVMTSVLGDNWTHVVALVRKGASLTAEERSAYWSAWSDDYNANVSAYDDAWRAVIVFVGPGGAALRALGAFGGYDYGGAYVAAALARRSEVDREHYDVRTRVWRRMFGPIHPDDPAVA